MARPIQPRRVRRYSVEFKLHAVRLSQADGVSVAAVAAALQIHRFLLSRWRRQVRLGLLYRDDPPAIAREHET